MVNPFLRMAHWVRHPPSPGRVKLVLAVVALCLLLAAIEWIFGWPEALTLEDGGRGRFVR
ncbi:hypothetical protein M8756_00920 [Lutimaribacter sp. EGI FJ00015]|uniref:Uncharacterized protein n=1 Tax=Lutimaribacter degradans TaxID=2945989 RepID=A0ACC5ZSE1_9RHOB|nr:hypothetical protein [Lutimaribacter sp. EGI FJ00013]MCM2561197.1 hypothetical protein [Lutimaribacter sp. EGI FJ00013]MCO0611854.1 hypothetical protein [Lutimaribacter sp. EGI FJ00015]MCO0635025.1 hypothetical protein [Lutimaribacter sp. EGI FJ00014]